MRRKVRPSEVWYYFKRIDKDGKDGEFNYICRICGEVVDRSHRIHHLRFKHPALWEKIVKKSNR